MYHKGEGVEKDLKKEMYHLEKRLPSVVIAMQDLTLEIMRGYEVTMSRQ